jgi:protein-S-isoprenylcysteine O-methyltransferase Ste14
VGHGAAKLAPRGPPHKPGSLRCRGRCPRSSERQGGTLDLATIRLAALAALVPLAVAVADTPLRTFGQKFVAHRWAERLVLFSIELNLLLLWTLAKLFLGRDAALAPEVARTPLAVTGAVLAWTGAAFTVWAKFTLGRWYSASFGVKLGHELVTRGPYAIVRHPMYTGVLVLGMGLGVAYNSAITLGLALVFVVPLVLHALIEEQLFARHFGSAWDAYRARVPMLVPGLRPRC